jgi:hypothetical protein
MGEPEFNHIQTPEYKAISGSMDVFDSLISKSSDNKLLKDIG